MQLMPATARELAGRFGLPYSHEKLSDPDFNIRLGTSYFSQVLDMFEGNQELALAGYNGGPYRIKRWWREWGSSDIDRFLEGLASRRVEDLREADRGPLGQLPPALSAAGGVGALTACERRRTSRTARTPGHRPSVSLPSLCLGSLASAAAPRRSTTAPSSSITFESLRADALGPLGGPPGLMPHLEKLAREADWVGRGIAPSSAGVPSLGLLLPASAPGSTRRSMKAGRGSLRTW